MSVRHLITQRAVTVWCLLACAWLLSASWAEAGKPQLPRHLRDQLRAQPKAPHAAALPSFDLHVAPMGWWRQLVQRHQPGVVMTYGQWQRHWTALQAYLKRTQDTRSLPPLLQHLAIKGQVRGDQLALTMTLRMKLMAQGWQWFPLPLKGMGLASFRFRGLDGTLLLRCPKKASCAAHQKQLWVAVRGPATGTLALEGGVAIRKTPQGRSVRFQVPPVVASTLQLRLPGQQELQGPLKSLMLKRQGKETWIAGSLGGASHVKLLYRPLEAGTHKETRVATVGHTRITLHPQFQWLSATLQLKARMGQRSQYEIPMPSGFRLLSIRAPRLLGVAIAAKGKTKQQRLYVRLGKAAQGKPRRLQLRLVRQGPLRSLQARPLTIAGAYSQTGHMSVSVHRSLKARIVGHRALDRVPLSTAKAKHPAGLSQLPGAVQMRFRYWSGDSRVSLALRPVRARFDVTPTLDLTIARRQARMTVALRLRVREGRLLTVPLVPPSGWQLNQLTDAAHKPLRHQRQGQRYEIQLARPLSAGATADLRMVFVRRIQLPRRGAQTLQLPQLKVPDAMQQKGSMLLTYPRDYEGQLQDTRYLRERTTSKPKGALQRRSLALLQAGYKGRLALTRKAVRMQLLTVSRYQLKPARMIAQIDVYAAISGASINALDLHVARAVGSKIQFRASTGRIVEQTRLTTTTDKGRLHEVWRLAFARERFGRVPLEVQITRPLSDQPQQLLLPQVSGSKRSEAERGFASVSSAPHIRIKPQAKGLNPLDPSLVPAPLFVSKQTTPLLAYHYQQTKRSLALELRPMTAQRLLTALVRYLTVEAQWKGQGVLHVKATLQLQSKGLSAFEAELPKHSELWSATLNRVGVKPMRRGRQVRIPLPPHEQSTYTIALHYQLRGVARASQGAIQAPTFPYPVQQTRWNVRTPDDYVAFASTAHSFSQSHKPKALLWSGLRLLRKKPALGILALILVMLFVLRPWVGRLLGAFWSLLLTLLQAGVAILRYLFDRWYRWGIAVLFVLGFLGLLTLGSWTFVRNSKQVEIKRFPSRYSRLVPPTSRAPAGSNSAADAPTFYGKKDSGGAKASGKDGKMGSKYRRKKRKKRKFVVRNKVAPQRAFQSWSRSRPPLAPAKPKLPMAPPPPPPRSGPLPHPMPAFKAQKPADGTPRSDFNDDKARSKSSQSRRSGRQQVLKELHKKLARRALVVKKPPKKNDIDANTQQGQGKSGGKRASQADPKPIADREEVDAIAKNKPTNSSETTGSKQRIKKSGLLGTLSRGMGDMGKGNVFGKRDFLGKMLKPGAKGFGGLGVKQQQQQQKQRMLQWMMRSGEQRMMRGIRSISLAMPKLGANLGTWSTGLVPELRISLWRVQWLRWLALLCFLGSLLLGLLVAWRCPKQRTLFFWAGLILSLVAGILVSGVAILCANAITLGIVLAGLLAFARRSTPDDDRKASVSHAAKSVAGMVILVASLAGMAPQSAHAADGNAASKTTTGSPKAAKPNAAAKAPKAAKAAKAAAAKATAPCVLPFVRHANGLQLPGSTARLFVPQTRPGSGAQVSAHTPVFVPHRWWMLLRGFSPECLKRPKQVRFWQQAHYILRVVDEARVMGTVHVQVRLLAKGWHRVPLGLQGAYLNGQSLQGPKGKAVAGHIRYRSQGGYEALLKGPGLVSIKLQVRLAKSRKARSLALQVGPAQAARLTLSLAGAGWHVAIPQAKGGISSDTHKGHTVTRAYLGQSSQAQTIRLTWRKAQRDSATRHEAAQVFETTHVSLKKHLLRLRSQFAISHRFRRSDRFAFVLPQGAILERLVAPKMRRWYLKDQTRAKGKQTTLIVRLHRPVQQITIELQVALLRQGKQQRHRLPLVAPVGVSQHTGIVGIRSSASLQFTLLGADGLEKRSPSDYRQATNGWGGSVEEAYAFRRQPALTTILRPKRSKPHVTAQLKVGYTHARTRLRAHIQYSQVPQATFVVAFDISADKGLQLHKVESLQGPKVRQYWLGPVDQTRRRLFVELEKPLQRGQRLIIEAGQSHGDVAPIPLLVPHGAKQLKGTLMLFVPKDLEAQTEGRSGLDEIEPSSLSTDLDHDKNALDGSRLALYNSGVVGRYSSEEIDRLEALKTSAARLLYRFVGSYQGRIQLRKEVTTAQCQGEVSLKLEEHVGIVDVRLVFQASGAGQRHWSLTVPKAVAGQLQWTQKPGSGELRRHTTRGQVTFTWKLLQPSTRGVIAFRYRLAVPRSGVVAIGGIAPVGVANWKLHLLLKKGSHIRIHLPKTLAKDIDKASIGSLPSRLRKQRDLIAAYTLKTNDWRFSARRETLRTAIALQPIVELARLETSIAPSGQAWSQALYTLRSPGLQTITLQLPPKAKLWQVTVAGQELRPARDTAGHYILPLPPKQTSDLAYQIRVLYAHKVTLPDHYGQLSMTPPKLQPIDTAETFWVVRIPYRYKIAWTAGNMDRTLAFHIATQQLKQSIQFAQKLKKMAAVGTRQQQWRARRNLVQQQRSIRRQLTKALRAQRRANRFRYDDSRKGKLSKLNSAMSNLRQSAGDLLQSKKPAQQASDGISLDPTAHWKRQFQLKPQQTIASTPALGYDTGYFHIYRSGRSSTYVTVGGDPQLTLKLYHRDTTKRAVGWLGWLALLLLSLFIWRKWF